METFKGLLDVHYIHASVRCTSEPIQRRRRASGAYVNEAVERKREKAEHKRAERASEEYKSAGEANGLKLPPPLVLVPTELNSKTAQGQLAAASRETT